MFAIISDYDLASPECLSDVRAVLSLLAESAEDEAASFDPSGSGGLGPQTSGIAGEEASERGRSMPGCNSNSDDASLSQGNSALEDGEFAEGTTVSGDEDDRRESGGDADLRFEMLDDGSKEELLVEMFPGIKPFDVKWTLKKCNGGFKETMEELLNQVFLLEEVGGPQKGIEAFAEGDLKTRKRKPKGGRKEKALALASKNGSSSSGESSFGESKWETARRDVEFLAAKTGLPVEKVGSLYHTSGASVPATLAAILDLDSTDFTNISPEDALVQYNAYNLGLEYPAICAARLLTIVKLTYPSTVDANELAKALLARATSKKTGGIHIDFRLPPVDLSDGPVARPQALNAIHSSASGLPPDNSAAAKAAAYNAARGIAFTKATAAYRKGKSDRLMGGAAAYYSSVGREFDAKAKSAESAAADALVASQRSRTELDLHGITVKDAVRISREKVTAWWTSDRDSRAYSGNQEGSGRGGTGYKIITGIGRHSEGGFGKLGPAVGKMLIREGWKVEVGSGVLLVQGVAKKR